MRHRPARSAAAGIISLFILGACDLAGPQACTLIGCASGLAVTLAPAPSSAYSVALIVPGGSAPPAITCPNPATCAPVAFFESVSAESVTVVVTVGENEFRRNVQPTYTTSRPNGPQCDPTCRQGAVTVTLPSAGHSSTER